MYTVRANKELVTRAPFENLEDAQAAAIQDIKTTGASYSRVFRSRENDEFSDMPILLIKRISVFDPTRAYEVISL